MTKPNNTHCDPAVLLETVGDDRDIFLELIEIFFRESASKFIQLKSAAAAGDVLKCGQYSHALKGTVGPLDATALMYMLQDLEDECRQQRFDCDPARVSAIGHELNQVKAEVQQFLGSL